MYTLIHGFYKYLTQKDEFCVLILGLDNVGKTVIITNFLNNYIIDTLMLNIIKLYRLIWNHQKQSSRRTTRVLIQEKSQLLLV